MRTITATAIGGASPTLWLDVIHSPDDGGYYFEVVNKAGKTLETGPIEKTFARAEKTGRVAISRLSPNHSEVELKP